MCQEIIDLVVEIKGGSGELVERIVGARERKGDSKLVRVVEEKWGVAWNLKRKPRCVS